MRDLVYYLPGFGGQLATGLGQGLRDRGFDVTGRETRGEFKALSFDDQVCQIQKDLQEHFWHPEARVLCNSFGGYLFLHAQAQMEPFVGRVLLLSPIVGDFESEETRTTFSPPKPAKLRELAESGRFPAPKHCAIHVGENDWQSIPANVVNFGKLTGIPVVVAQGRGHNLGADYVGPLLDEWVQN